MLLESRQIAKMISSYVGENKLFEQQYLNGDLELELTPQEALAERTRAGIPAFYTKTGVSTVVADGRPVETFDGEDYVRETWLRADLSIIKAWRADPAVEIGRAEDGAPFRRSGTSNGTSGARSSRRRGTDQPKPPPSNARRSWPSPHPQ